MQPLYAGLAEIFEVEEGQIGPDSVLADYNWDSLAIVSTIALADETDNVLLDGASLVACVRAGDIAALIERAKAA